MEELGVGIASLLLGLLSLAPFPAPFSVPTLVWALTVSAFVFLVLFVAAHIWKAHSSDPVAWDAKLNRSHAGNIYSPKPMPARTRAGAPKNGKKKKSRR